MRPSDRDYNAMREVILEPDYTKHAAGSVHIAVGHTRVLCTCSVEDRVPPFLLNKNQGWITAEYGMLPGSTSTRTAREAARGKQSGRTVEIQRLIGRSLRSVVNLSLLGARTFLVDCDVLQADGGTRTAAITSAYVALHQALQTLKNMGVISSIPLRNAVAATSVGIVHSYMLLDLCYDEDSSAAVDFNVVMTDKGEFVEVQGTAEGKPFTKQTIDSLLALAEKGIKQLFEIQKTVLGLTGKN